MTCIKTRASIMRRFRHNTRGSVAIAFALASIPLIMAAGVAIDLVHAGQVQSRLQAALDAGALAAASSSLSNKQRKQQAELVFAANFNAQNTRRMNARVSISLDGNKVSMSGEVKVPTTFTRIAGYNDMDVASSVEINIPEARKAEIALVLDYSGSMNEFSGGKRKYRAMRDAAIKLVDDLSQKGKSDKVKFGLVPFSHHVRLTLPSAHVAGKGTSGSWTGCTQDRQSPHNVKDTTPARLDEKSKWGHPFHPSHAGAGCSGYSPRHLTVRPVGKDHAGVIRQLERMTPYAWTHISLGFSIGWHLLSPGAPFTGVASYGDTSTSKYLVLLTDGRQTEPAYGSNGKRTVALGESNLEKLCKNAKAKGITVVTLAFDLRHSATKKRLRQCASDAKKYFFVAEDNAELANAFEQIKADIQQVLYISK